MCTMSKMNPIKAKDAPKAQGRQMTAAALKEDACRERRYKRPHYHVHFTPTKSADQTVLPQGLADLGRT